MLKTAAAAVLYEVNSDTLLYAWNPDARMEPASLVKILTGLLAVENTELTDVVTVTQTAVDAVPDGAVTEELLPGEELTMEDLLYCLMVGGANDAATVIAEYVAGSQAEFIQMMNDRALALGCTNTNFTNSHGMYDENQYTSARDMAKIVRDAMKNETFMVFFAALRYSVPETNMTEQRHMQTTNYLMTPGVSQVYYDRRVTGGRTGIADNGYRSMASTASSDGLEYVCIVLNAVPTYGENIYTINRFGNYEETKDLLALAFDNLQVTQVLNQDQVVTQCTVNGGDNHVVVGPDASVSSVLPVGLKAKDVSYRYSVTGNGLSLPVQPGQKLTTIEVWYGSVCLAQANLETKNTVLAVSSGQDFSTQPQFSSEGLMKVLIVVGIAAAIVVILAGLLYIIRFVNISRVRAQRRRRSANRRRSR